MNEQIKLCLMAGITAFIICAALSPIIIPILRKIKLGQYIRENVVQTHLKKAGTPTMGGILIILAFTIAALFFSKGNQDVIAILLVTFAYCVLGFADDFIKVTKKRNLGLRAWEKIVWQVLISGLFSYYLLAVKHISTEIIIPFTDMTFDLGIFFVPFVFLVMVATVNSVNLTDGLDGLATGVTIIVTTFFGLCAYNLYPALSSSASALIGALLGFLIFNAHPAKIFMGDTGSLALGGFLASFAIIMQMPLFLIIAGFVYVAESLSDIIQVASYKLRGKRVFKMAPLHHHFELCGWHETKVVRVFYIATAIFCIISFLAI